MLSIDPTDDVTDYVVRKKPRMPAGKKKPRPAMWAQATHSAMKKKDPLVCLNFLFDYCDKGGHILSAARKEQEAKRAIAIAENEKRINLTSEIPEEAWGELFAKCRLR